MTSKDKVAEIKQLLGLSEDTDKSEMSECHRKIIEDVEQQ